MNKSDNLVTALVFGLIALLLCCLCLAIAGGAMFFVGIQPDSTSRPLQATSQVTFEPWEPPTRPAPTIDFDRPTASPEPGATPSETGPEPSGDAATETLNTLETAIVPVNDPIGLAERLEGKENLPVNLETPVKIYQEGDQETFWVTNSDNNENTQVSATLRYVTDHVYFWVANGVKINQNDLKKLVDTFETEIYPTNRAFFGSEWTPGVDADPHLYILYTRGLGGSVAGYFSPGDEYLPMVREYSNGHEMFLLSADHVTLNEEFAYSVLAHEFQHMIHWYRDRNEETWVNEGASDLAAFLNDYDIGGHDYMFVMNPDIQLTDWPTEPDNRTAHYGAAFLFMTYFLDRFGDQATQALIADPANGMASIDKVLSELGITDPATGKTLTADDVFIDWTVANYLQDKDVADGRYTYHNYADAPDVSETETIDDCPTDPFQRDISQHGADYLLIRCQGDYRLRFEGLPSIQALPVDPHSGSYAFYSNRGDESNMTLTQSFDFTNHSGPLSLNYWTWYDLEEDYDYAYVTASTDGEHWKILTTPSGTADDPSGNSYGWGYNGASGGGPQWIEETLDLSEYAGQNVQIRFEYITDGAVNGEGLLVDDISIPEIGYSTDFEQDDGGWEAAGFVRIQNALPQIYSLALIRLGNQTEVELITLPADNRIEIPISLGGEVDELVLVVSGLTRHTRQKAPYQITILPR